MNRLYMIVYVLHCQCTSVYTVCPLEIVMLSYSHSLITMKCVSIRVHSINVYSNHYSLCAYIAGANLSEENFEWGNFDDIDVGMGVDVDGMGGEVEEVVDGRGGGRGGGWEGRWMRTRMVWE